MRKRLAAALLSPLLLAAPAAAEEAQQPSPQCTVGICQLRLTPQQLLARAETLVRARRYGEAQPLIDALAQSPETRFQSRFLDGYAASQQGNFAHAADVFKGILADDPRQTRVRLELARTMVALGQMGSAERQFRLAEADGELPPDIARAIRGFREVIRSRRAWRLDVDFGIAPDSNINNATGNDTVTVLFGDTSLPVALDSRAKARSGTGVTGSVSAGLRLPVTNSVAALVDLDANGTDYDGRSFDDYLVQLAAGPEFRVASNASLSIEAVGAQRWFGGHLASRQGGAKAGAQLTLGTTRRVGVQLDVRHTEALFDRNYSGWQGGLFVTGEQAVARTFVASLGGFVRRDELRADAYSNTELGVTAGFGGELPLGISFGASGSISHAEYDAPIPMFSIKPRDDWRASARLTVGNRKVRVFGFSPQAMLSWARNSSSIDYYTTDRVRLRLALARYF